MDDQSVERIPRPEWTQAEQSYIGLFGGWVWEVVGVAPGGHLDTAFGNSPLDALQRAEVAGLRPL